MYRIDAPFGGVLFYCPSVPHHVPMPSQSRSQVDQPVNKRRLMRSQTSGPAKRHSAMANSTHRHPPAGSTAKPIRMSLSHPAPDIVKIEMDTITGVVCTPSRRNKYNQAGLSLDAINLQLSGAFGPQDDPALLGQYLGEELLCNAQAKRKQDLLSSKVRILQVPPSGRGAGTAPKPTGSSIDQVVATRMLALPVSSHLIQSTDKKMADLIKKAPLSLLQSPAAQDALARWTYATGFSHDKAIRDQAKKFLSACLPSRQGNPGKTRAESKMLLAAYDGLCLYCKCIFAAAIDGRNETKLKSLFPDVNDLALSGIVVQDLLNSKFKKPAPSDVASSYIAKWSGLSIQRVRDLISKARSVAKSLDP